MEPSSTLAHFYQIGGTFRPSRGGPAVTCDSRSHRRAHPRQARLGSPSRRARAQTGASRKAMLIVVPRRARAVHSSERDEGKRDEGRRDEGRRASFLQIPNAEVESNERTSVRRGRNVLRVTPYAPCLVVREAADRVTRSEGPIRDRHASRPAGRTARRTAGRTSSAIWSIWDPQTRCLSQIAFVSSLIPMRVPVCTPHGDARGVRLTDSLEAANSFAESER
jgi:hypothetical protein